MTHPGGIGDAPIEGRLHKAMNGLAAVIDEAINGPIPSKGLGTRVLRNGFCLMIFPFEGFDGRANYISNAKREDIVTLLKEQLARFEGQPEQKGSA